MIFPETKICQKNTLTWCSQSWYLWEKGIEGIWQTTVSYPILEIFTKRQWHQISWLTWLQFLKQMVQTFRLFHMHIHAFTKFIHHYWPSQTRAPSRARRGFQGVAFDIEYMQGPREMRIPFPEWISVWNYGAKLLQKQCGSSYWVLEDVWRLLKVSFLKKKKELGLLNMSSASFIQLLLSFLSHSVSCLRLSFPCWTACTSGPLWALNWPRIQILIHCRATLSRHWCQRSLP